VVYGATSAGTSTVSPNAPKKLYFDRGRAKQKGEGW